MFHYTTLQQQRQTLIPCLCFRVQLLKPLNFLQQYWIVRFFEHVIVKITEQANWNERKRPNLVAGASSFLNRCTNKLRQLLVDPVWPLEGSKSGYEKFEDLKLSFQGERPSHEVFAEDFTTSVSNIRKLIDQQIATTDSDPNAIQLDSSYPHVQMAPILKFRHAVFEVSSDQSFASVSECHWPAKFTEDGWKCLRHSFRLGSWWCVPISLNLSVS